MPHWGKKLRDYLEYKMPGAEQKDWAEALDVKPQNVSLWVNCKVEKVPSELVIQLIRWQPSFDANYLYRDDWPSELSETKMPPYQTDTGARIEESLYDLDSGDSVEPIPREPELAHAYAGWTMIVGGREQLACDIIVRGRKDRAVMANIAARDKKPEND